MYCYSWFDLTYMGLTSVGLCNVVSSMLSSRMGVISLIGCSASVVVSDWFRVTDVKQPSGPRGLSPRLENGFWSVDFNGLLILFRCIILFLSVVIACFVPATATSGLVSHALPKLFLFTFFSEKEVWEFVTNVFFEFAPCFHHHLIMMPLVIRECVQVQCFAEITLVLTIGDVFK